MREMSPEMRWRGTVVESPAPGAWDLAFRRFEVRVNGGAGSAQNGGVAQLEEIAWRHGWITKDDLLRLADKYRDTAYGNYLAWLAKGPSEGASA